MGQQLTEIIITILMVMGIGRISESIQPKQYYAILETGKIMQIEVGLFNRYACPKKCGIAHFHRVHVCRDEHLDHPELIQMMIQDKKKLIPISIGNSKIIDLVEILPEKSKRKKKAAIPIQMGKQLPWL